MSAQGLCLILCVVSLVGCTRSATMGRPCPFSSEWIQKVEIDRTCEAYKKHLETKGGQFDIEPEKLQPPLHEDAGVSSGSGFLHMDSKAMIKHRLHIR